MLQAALILALQKADRTANINDRAAFARSVQRSILVEHEALWVLWLQDTPDATVAQLVEAATPVSRAVPSPLDDTVAASLARMDDWTGRGRGEDRHPQFDPLDDA